MALEVVGSNPISHPRKDLRCGKSFFYFSSNETAFFARNGFGIFVVTIVQKTCDMARQGVWTEPAENFAVCLPQKYKNFFGYT